MKNPLFYAKILLFGEYGIIEDAMGLSIPYNFYKGQLISKPNQTQFSIDSNHNLLKLYNYLIELKNKEELIAEVNFTQFKKELDEGIWFDSTIPQGFGVGSSGAIVAAIYEKYGISKIPNDKLLASNKIGELKKIFSQIESCFHGKSSGLDPLICYLNLPILIKSKTDLNTISLPIQNTINQGAIFLLDSGQPGETRTMVNIFLEKCKNEGFRKMIKNQFNKHNDACIKAFINGDKKPLFENLKHLSKILFEHFKPMIPDSFKNLWKQGIDSNAFYLKLCGSGGGGFILGFTQDLPKAKEILNKHHLEVIYQF